MKIAILADPLDNQSAGIHQYTRNLVQHLIMHLGQDELIVVRERKDPNLEGCTQLALWNTRLPIGYASFRMFVLIPFLLNRLKVDVVIDPAHFGPFNLPRRISRVTVIHDLTPILFPHWHRWHSQMLQRIFLKGILKRAHLVIANSENTENDIHRVFPFTKTKTKTLLLGVDPNFKRTAKREYLDQKGIRSPYFHFNGTIEPRKGLPILLNAYHQFRSRIKERVQLVLAGGNGWKSGNIYQSIENHAFSGDILILGFVPQEVLIQLHSHSIALIYPSYYEGFGLPVVEALACDCPVITSNNSSLKEVGAGMAEYFETGDEAELCQKMLSMFNSSSQETGRFAIQVRDKYDWNNYAVNFLNLMKSSIR